MTVDLANNRDRTIELITERHTLGDSATIKAALRESVEAGHRAGVYSAQCYLLARPKAEWACVECKNPATCFSPFNDGTFSSVLI